MRTAETYPLHVVHEDYAFIAERADSGGQTYRRSVRARVTFKNDAARAMYEDVATDIEMVDWSLRKNLSGLDVATVVPEVHKSFAEIGLQLSRFQAHDYARSISERQDFEFVLE